MYIRAYVYDIYHFIWYYKINNKKISNSLFHIRNIIRDNYILVLISVNESI